ncbi:hypothetical protein E4U10_000312 [Claviceps purpurea]|nr:hypothetical protein E4U10_000312 [Claviceps purpurea]
MPKEQFPGKVSAAILDPVMIEGNAPQTVFTATENHSHMLANSTLFDNCGAMHVVYNEALLEPGSFKLTFGDCLEAGTTSFPIYGRGTRIIKNILHGNKGPCTEDLILNDVAVVRGFHVNIVSESKLVEKNIWYCGSDSTLRYGTVEKNTVLAQLIRKFNIVFLEYKPLAFGDDIHMKSAYDCDVIEDKVLGAGSFVPVETMEGDVWFGAGEGCDS